VKQFLFKVGRRKYVLPIYEALARTPRGRILAQGIFHEAKGNYHSVTRASVWKVLQAKK
jgi:leukotriene-A4 hydrolase